MIFVAWSLVVASQASVCAEPSEAPLPSEVTLSDLWLSVSAALAYAATGDEQGLGVGGDVGVLCVSCLTAADGSEWVGGYVDGLHDLGAGMTRLGAGARVGWSAVGLDTGYVVGLSGDDVAHGFQARALLMSVYFSVYGRYGFFPSMDLHHGEFGVQLSWPQHLFAW